MLLAVAVSAAVKLLEVFVTAQEVALVDDQVRVAVWPEVKVEGLEVNEIVGAAAELATPSDNDWVADPPSPVQVAVYVVAVVGSTVILPLVPVFAAVKLFEVLTIAHDVAFVELHESVALSPEVILEALAVNETVGAAGVPEEPPPLPPLEPPPPPPPPPPPDEVPPEHG